MKRFIILTSVIAVAALMTTAFLLFNDGPADAQHNEATPASTELSPEYMNDFLANGKDPVTIKVHELQAQGMNEDEIIQTLEKMGMGWYPPTGATWIGRTPTAYDNNNTTAPGFRIWDTRCSQ